MRWKPFFLEIKRQVAADETAGAGDDNQIILFQVLGPFRQVVLFPYQLFVTSEDEPSG